MDPVIAAGFSHSESAAMRWRSKTPSLTAAGSASQLGSAQFSSARLGVSPARWHGWVSHRASPPPAPPPVLPAALPGAPPRGCSPPRFPRPREPPPHLPANEGNGRRERGTNHIKREAENYHGKPPRGRFCFSPLAINSCNLQSLA